MNEEYLSARPFISRLKKKENRGANPGSIAPLILWSRIRQVLIRRRVVTVVDSLFCSYAGYCGLPEAVVCTTFRLLNLYACVKSEMTLAPVSLICEMD